MQFASLSDMQRPETSFVGGAIYTPPWQNLVPVEPLGLHMQDIEVNILPGDPA